MAVSFDKNVDYAQRVIDLKRAGAPDYQIVEAMAQRQAKQDAGYGSQYMSNEIFAGVLGGLTSGSGDKAQQGTSQPSAKVDSYDDNGIAKVTVAGYDPGDFSGAYTSASSSSSSGISNILGYVVIGLIGIALLDRFVGGSGKK